ncbi:MAG: hypothetical protein IV086_11120 [Hyphomonadaceae bacterium]|nr:hypothetical protein [Hyphomonadaceae bacterium]
MFFGPKTPIAAVVPELRAFCDQTALGVLGNYLEGETHRPDLTISAAQKQLYMDLWANMVFVIGSRFRQGKAQRLCIAAMQAEVRGDPRQAEIQSMVSAMVDRTTNSQENVQDILDVAFGSGAFDHTKRPRGLPGADLAMCIRAADHLAGRIRF